MSYSAPQGQPLRPLALRQACRVQLVWIPISSTLPSPSRSANRTRDGSRQPDPTSYSAAHG
jgi:hypothetical protein